MCEEKATSLGLLLLVSDEEIENLAKNAAKYGVKIFCEYGQVRVSTDDTGIIDAIKAEHPEMVRKWNFE